MNPVDVVPSERQVRHQALEFYGFLHFGMNTFTGREWGDGREAPSLFAPARLNALQWIGALKKAGMRGAILTCKHHDGFCLWPSRYTAHSVASSPCRGDVVRQVADACRAEGLAFGVYLSPWDRHEASYGLGAPYDDFYVNQLTELLTGYGDIFAVWLDGACGEGPSGHVQRYDWARYEKVVRALQPNACLSVCGPDVRWCGNEAGETRPSEWSVVPARLRDAERVSAASQHADGDDFRRSGLKSSDLDLGSREAIAGEEELIWYPAEVNTSIRPGWFYHPEEDGRVLAPDALYGLYLRSVGGNATFLLNVPPTPEGLIHPADEAALAGLGARLCRAFERTLFEGAAPGGWEFIIALDGPERLGLLRLKEDIRFSQRVEAFDVTLTLNGREAGMYHGTTVGYQRLVPLGGAVADRVTVRVTASRAEPAFLMAGLYGV